MGYVYFFKHNNLDAVKIGATMNDPEKRLKAFLTYAPYGGECLGYIETEDPFKLERELHNKFKEDRLYGEWFDIGYIDDIYPLLLNTKTKVVNSLYRYFEYDFPYDFNYKSHSDDFLKFTKYAFENIIPNKEYDMSDVYTENFVKSIGDENKFHFNREEFIKKYCNLFNFGLEKSIYCVRFTIKQE